MTMNEKARTEYFKETAIVLAREGFEVEQMEAGHLRIHMYGEPLCEVNGIGSITYRSEYVASPEREAAKDKVFEAVSRTAEYMRLMEQALFLEIEGLEDRYKLLAEFNDTVLAGMNSKFGVVFATWDRTDNGDGLSHGHYFMENYEGAKKDFAVRSHLIPKDLLFTNDQMIEIYRCCEDTLNAGYELTYEQDSNIRGVQEQIMRSMPDILDQIREQDLKVEESRMGEQTM